MSNRIKLIILEIRIFEASEKKYKGDVHEVDIGCFPLLMEGLLELGVQKVNLQPIHQPIGGNAAKDTESNKR